MNPYDSMYVVVRARSTRTASRPPASRARPRIAPRLCARRATTMPRSSAMRRQPAHAASPHNFFMSRARHDGDRALTAHCHFRHGSARARSGVRLAFGATDRESLLFVLAPDRAMARRRPQAPGSLHPSASPNALRLLRRREPESTPPYLGGGGILGLAVRWRAGCPRVAPLAQSRRGVRAGRRASLFGHVLQNAHSDLSGCGSQARPDAPSGSARQSQRGQISQ